MRKDLYSMKLLLTLFIYVCLQTTSLAQAPILLSVEGAPLIFELPLDASTTQSLSANTAIKLATPLQHIAQGMAYPEWLSDASFNVKNRPGQRLSIVVAPKRGNPELSTELLLTLNNAGRRSFKPLHLMFDTVSRFVGEPLPTTTASVTPTEDKPDTVAAQPAPVIRFPAAPVATSAPIPPQPQTLSTNTSLAVSAGNQTPPRSNSTLRARSTSGPIGMAPIAPAPVPAKTISAPTLPAITPLPLPARSVKPLPALPPASPYGLDNWLQNWPTLVGGLALLLALLYVINRAFKSWRERRGNQLPTTFLEPQPTALAPEESGANTVFGVSEEEANAMHAKWLREQTTKRV